MRSALVLVATLSLLILVPGVAHACPSCFSGTEEGREAFFLTFVLLTTLPLLTVGGVVYWLFRRAKQLDRDSARRPPSTAATTSTMPTRCRQP